MINWLLNSARIFWGAAVNLFSNGGGYVHIDTLEESCVSHYRMNDALATTNVIDSQGYSDGTAQQDTEDLTTTGKINGALTFNGTTDYVDTNNHFQSVFQSSFSVNGWFRTSVFQSQAFLGTFSSSGFLLWATKSGGSVYPYVAYTAGPIGFTSQSTTNIDSLISSNEWFMITCTVDEINSIAFIYINGVVNKQAGPFAAIDFSNYSNSRTLYIGAEHTYTSIFLFNGLIDDVSIHNKVLNSEEIYTLWNSGRGTEDFQLTPNLNFDGSELIMAGV